MVLRSVSILCSAKIPSSSMICHLLGFAREDYPANSSTAKCRIVPQTTYAVGRDYTSKPLPHEVGRIVQQTPSPRRGEDYPTISSPALRGRIKEGAERADQTGESGWCFWRPPLNPLPQGGRGVCGWTLPQAGGEIVGDPSHFVGGEL